MGVQFFFKSPKLRPVSSGFSLLPRLHPTHQHPSFHSPPSNVPLILSTTQDFPSNWHQGAPACRYVAKIFPVFFATHRGSCSKTVPFTQILTFHTLKTSSSCPCPDTTRNPSTTTPQLPRIALVTGGYQFSRGRTNRKRHKTHESCISIRPLASKIFTRTVVSFPTGMQPPRRHSATTNRGKPSRRGALSQFVATEVS